MNTAKHRPAGVRRRAKSMRTFQCFVAWVILWTACLISGHAVGAEETPWRSHENGTLRTGMRWDYTLGYTFRPLVDGTITAVAGYFDGTRKVTIWDEDRNRVREAYVTSHNNWAEVPLADPYELEADHWYRITVYAAGAGASYRSSTDRWPQTYGNIEIGGYCYAGGDTFPTHEGTYGYLYGQVDIRFASGCPTLAVPNNSMEFRALYHNNTSRNSADLSGPCDSEDIVAYPINWGGRPDTTVNWDYFASRYEGDFDFEEGDYTFTVSSDDGVRISIDGGPWFVNEWRRQVLTDFQTVQHVTAGRHRITVEHYEHNGGANLYLAWEKSADGGSAPAWERWSRVYNRWEQTSGSAPIRVVILAEAFTAAEINDFQTMADEIRKWFYQVEPYNTVGYERIDLYRVNSISNQSGIGADPADARDTAFEARRDLLVAKTIKPTDYERVDDALSSVPSNGAYVTVYCMLCNTANLNHDARARAWMPPFLSSPSQITDRGCVTNSDSQLINGVPEYARTAIHELGHAIGSLGDEYPGGNGEPFIPRHHYQNISAYDDLVNRTLENRKWYQWLEVPWNGTTIGAEPIGNGWFRPTNNLCIMHHQHYDAFCPVCKEHLAAMILSACGHVAMGTPYREGFESIGSTAVASSAGSPEPQLHGCSWNHDNNGPIDGGSVHSGHAGLNYNNGNDYACGHNAGTASTPLVHIGDLASPVLSFYYNYDAEEGQLYDRRYVEILKWDSGHGVFRWATEPIQLHGESRNTWLYKEIDLDPGWDYVMIRFRFDTGDDFLNGKPGWFIDDLRIGE